MIELKPAAGAQPTPEQRKRQLRAAINTFAAELDYPASSAYTRYCREQKAKLERELAELEGEGQEV